MTQPFQYPEKYSRRHGPIGYADAANYRPWLRDEFSFRCVYCLLREQWGQVRGTFSIDHFLPTSLFPDQALTYENLLHACVGCNGVKSNKLLPDPFASMVAPHVWVTEEGALHSDSEDSRMLIELLGLDGDVMRQFRMLWIGILALARTHDTTLFRRLMGYPDQLPDLKDLSPPLGNSRPDGVQQCCFERRQRGDLPETY